MKSEGEYFRTDISSCSQNKAVKLFWTRQSRTHSQRFTLTLKSQDKCTKENVIQGY